MNKELLDGVTIIEGKISIVISNEWSLNWIIDIPFLISLTCLFFAIVTAVVGYMIIPVDKFRDSFGKSIRALIIILLLLLLIVLGFVSISTVYTVQIREHIAKETLTKLYDEYEIIEQNDRIWKIREK